jgi:hypothetical protein
MSPSQPTLSPYRHVVLFGFKPQTSPAQVEAIENAFRDLCASLPFVSGFEWGRNASPEGLNQGLSHCFLVTFPGEAERDLYLPHPAHQAFVKTYVEPHLDKVCVVDYRARD